MRTNRSSRQRFVYLFVGLLALLIVRAVTARSRIASALSSALGQPVAGAAALLLGCAAALVCSRSSDLQAQQVEFRPQAGLYLPTRISFHDGILHVRQKLGVTVGARVAGPAPPGSARPSGARLERLRVLRLARLAVLAAEVVRCHMPTAGGTHRLLGEAELVTGVRLSGTGRIPWGG